MKISAFAAVLSLSAVPAIAQVDTNASAPTQMYEKGPINTVVTHRDNEGYGGPRVIQVGDKVRLYTGGVDNFQAAEAHDKIFLWENPNTWQGWNSPYTFKGVLLPKTSCSGSTSNACRTTWNYALNGVWQYNGRVYLSASTGNLQHQWLEVLIGESNDGGQTFNYTGLVKATSGIMNFGVSWQPIVIAGETRFWGYVDFKLTSGAQGIGAIRFKPSPTAPFSIGPESIFEVWSGGQWRSLPRCNDGSPYTFCLNVIPDLIAPGVRFPRFVKMIRYNNRLELWGSTDAPHNDCGCDPHSPGELHRQNTFVYYAVQTPTSLSQDPLSLVGARQTLLQKNNPVRCLPGTSSHSRKHPTRLEWTYNLMYSRTWDDTVNVFGCNIQPPEGYIVATQLTVDPNAP